MEEDTFNSNGDMWEMKRKASFTKLSKAASRNVANYLKKKDQLLKGKTEKLWTLMSTYISSDIDTIQRNIVDHVEYTISRTKFNFDKNSCYRATAYSVRSRLIETLNDTNIHFFENKSKMCYYLSLEYLLGRYMQNALICLDLEDNYREALEDLGFVLEELYEEERDPALGNGGLGRLAACFLDSMATLNYPCWGYGIRYTYGIFEQKIVDGRQIEYPDYWLTLSNPWEIERPDCTYAVRFYGEVKETKEKKSNTSTNVKFQWTGGEIVQAMAYDNPIPGFDTYNTIYLRLWKACPSKEFDFHLFNVGKYLEAINDRQRAEYVTAVLYPNDNSEEGKELRLKQQYFFVCATLQDILRRFKKMPDLTWDDLPQHIVIQLNDTHPCLSIPEFMRLLIDIEGLSFEKTYFLARQIFNYTNHTVLPEALEKWSIHLFQRLLPRHLLIINAINFHFLNEVKMFTKDVHKIQKMSIFEEGREKKIRMANLATIVSTHVNGVAEIHSELVKRDLFPEYVEFFNHKGETKKFLNVTNGVTPRRWIYCANRKLAEIIDKCIGSDMWLKNLKALSKLYKHAKDEEFQKQWIEMKTFNKARLATWVEKMLKIKISSDMLFDVQVKRIHEYKRQLLNAFYITHRYLKIKKMTKDERNKHIVPRVSFIGGKAAPGYENAKIIIKYINNLSKIINSDYDVNPYLKLIFLPNYNVSNAQIIIPASDISQHISTAGTEASGTSNMKFVMNGGLIIGTMDGANVEIVQECGEDTAFIFGARENEIEQIRNKAREGNYPIDPRLNEVFQYIKDGSVSFNDPVCQKEFDKIINGLLHNRNGHNGDFYLLIHDFPDYCRAQDVVDKTYLNKKEWVYKSIKAVSHMGKFSSDRSVADYAKHIWKLTPCTRPQELRDNVQPNVNDETKEKREI